MSSERERFSPSGFIDVVLQPNENHRNDITLIEVQVADYRNKGGEEEDFQNDSEEDILNEIQGNETEIFGRSPGRPRKIFTEQLGRPRKEYHPPLAEVRYLESEEAFMTEIPLKEAISGPDNDDCLHAIADETKFILKNGMWQLIERPEDRQSDR